MKEHCHELILTAVGLLFVCFMLFYDMMQTPELYPTTPPNTRAVTESATLSDPSASQKTEVPPADEDSPVSDTTSAPDAERPININTASFEALKALPGIGDVKAQAIIDYRETYGAFHSIDEIMDVYGIGESTFEQIRNEITV